MAEAQLPKRTRTFGSAPVEGTEETVIAPLGFTLADEDFTVYPEAPGVVVLEFVEATSSKVQGVKAGALLGFLKSVMEDEEWERLSDVLHDPKNKIDISIISDIVGFLVEEYTSRPTPAS